MSGLHTHDTVKTNGHASGDRPATIRDMLETWMRKAITRVGDDEGEAIRLFEDTLRQHNKGFDVALKWLRALRAQHYLFASARSKTQQEKNQAEEPRPEETKPKLNQTAAPDPGEQPRPNGNGTLPWRSNVTTPNHAAANRIIVQSYLDRVIVNGRPVRHCTVEETREAGERGVIKGYFLLNLAAGLPEGTGKEIGDFHTDEDEVDRLYRIAELRSGNAATA